MKKFIYPIAAIFALITVSAFSSDDCKTKCTKKEAAKTHNHKTRNLHEHGKVVSINTGNSPIRQEVAIMESEPVVIPLTGFQKFDSLSFESDIQIDIQFSREETTIEVPDVLQADETVSFQFNAENGPVLAYQPKQAAY